MLGYLASKLVLVEVLSIWKLGSRFLDTASQEWMLLDDIKLFENVENASVVCISLLTHLAPIFIHGDGGGGEEM